MQKKYCSVALDMDAYVFCMSETDSIQILQKDQLSQWRAYGGGGRGGCVTINAKQLDGLASSLVGLQLNPVVYEHSDQINIINDIINDGEANFRNGSNNAVENTSYTLLGITPYMKSIGFKEENEWRLVFLPLRGIKLKVDFLPRRDFIAPYVKTRELFASYRNELLDSDELSSFQQKCSILPSPQNYIPISEIMVGPSAHQDLNRRAFDKVVAQSNNKIRITYSTIPYRSLG